MSNESKVMNQCFNGKHNICFSFKGRRDDQSGRKSQKIVLHNCIQTLLSDPIVVLSDSIGVGTSGMGNTAVGFNRKSSSGTIEVLEKYHILCMFRNNSIKSIYIDKNYAYVYYESCIDVFCIRTYQFVKKMNVEVANNKQVIFFENLILFNNSKSLFIYDIKNNCTSYFYKNFLKNIVIFDFNVNYLLCYKNNFGKCHIRVLQINMNAQKCEHELIFCVDFSSKFISHGKFLDDEKIIVAKNGRRLIIFDFKKAVDMYRIKKLKKKFWIFTNRWKICYSFWWKMKSSFLIYPLLYFTNWSYFIRHKNNKIIFSSDRGIYFIDYPVEEGA
ncbi:hypothetical protein PCYB_122710 [Plasmodium cynomolgi strain B]|uniref:Uncharacterized protein n=1 Tax=Plasmodium cynomolgi (strain B) TaxID=1120755 RepID=K6UVU9_PLACD|nr:hypothetical protein PCYB_122710 [Plasmodium cynomolgi strain B]GAB67704.1 hypothetical protein PCYB_122710 [Plasmodium cynomolgi strain B]